MQIIEAAPISKLKVLIADDHSFFRLGLKVTLSQLPYIRKIEEASNGVEVLKLLERNHYDIVFMDIQMPEMDGVEAVRQIRLQDNKTRIIALSMHASENYVMDLHSQNINGYLLKDTDLEEVKRAIENVMDGYQYFNPEVREILFSALVKKDRLASALSKSEPAMEITTREHDVLKLICDQYATSEIAAKLFVSENTVKFHRENLLEKTSSRNLAGLVLFAVKHGIYRIR